MTRRIAWGLAILWTLFAATPAFAQATYSFTAPPYAAVNDHPGAPAPGVRRPLAVGMQVTGSFTTATRLAPNLPNVEIGPQVTAYSFNDGVGPFASTDPNVRKVQFRVTTNATGEITSATIGLSRWQLLPSSTDAGQQTSRTDEILIFPGGGNVLSNRTCLVIATSLSNDADTCLSTNNTGDRQAPFAAGTWTSPPPPVPTMSEWAMIVLSVLLAGGALAHIGRRRSVGR